MATSSGGRRKGGSRKTDEQRDARPNGQEAATPDDALDRWSDLTVRELAAFGIGATTSALRAVQAVQQAQLDASREAQKLHEQAAAQLDSISNVADLARLQLSLAQSDSQVLLQSLSRIGELASRQALEALSDSAAGWAQLNGTAWNAALQWMNGFARTPDAELVEAEVDHIVNPIAASPFVWPAQEAAAQAMTLAGSAWNDWLTWSNRLADAGREAIDAAQKS